MKKKLICLAVALMLAVPVVKGIVKVLHTSNTVAVMPDTLNGSGDPGDPPPVA